MAWRIYYGDGSIWEEGDGPPSGEQARDVQAILQDDPAVGWFIQSGSDYYVYRGNRWWGCDLFGLFDWLLDCGLVVFGRTVSNAEFRQILARAKADRTLARKSGSLGRGQERILDDTTSD